MIHESILKPDKSEFIPPIITSLHMCKIAAAKNSIPRGGLLGAGERGAVASKTLYSKDIRSLVAWHLWLSSSSSSQWPVYIRSQLTIANH